MRKIVFDIETKNFFPYLGKADPAKLDISILCIYDSETDSYDSFLEEDFQRLWSILEKADILIGYNSEHFDIPILNRYYPGDLTKIKSLDLFKEVRDALGRRLPLGALAEATLGKKKLGAGADAMRWWNEGNIERLREYCIEDVRITKELYDYAKTYGFLKFRDKGEVKTIPLDTSHWEEFEKQSLTHTLPF